MGVWGLYGLGARLGVEGFFWVFIGLIGLRGSFGGLYGFVWVFRAYRV